MNRQDELRERYEDDLLALLMDNLLEEEGQALLEENEQLNADSAAAIPAELDERCRALLQSAFPDEPLKKPERVTWKILKRVLVAAVIAATMFVTACAAVPEFRAGVLNFFTRVDDIGTDFFFYSSGEGTSAPTQAPSDSLVIKDGMPFEFTYVPEGYELLLREAYDAGVFGADFVCAYNFPNDDPNNFRFEIAPITDGTNMFFDTEDAEVTNIKVHGYDGYLIQKTHSITGRECVAYLWFDLDNGLEFCFDSIGIPLEESQRIFDGIVIYGYEADTPAPTPAPSSPLVIKNGMPFEFSYVPEGYEQTIWEAYDRGANGTMYQGEYSYPYDDSNHFGFRISPIMEGTVLSIDTEDATTTNIRIYGFDGQLIQKIDTLSGKERITYLWFDLENCLMYCYNSIGIPFEESQRIFDGIVIYE